MINVIVEKCTVGTPILGWASMMCVVLFSFGIMMLMMGILGEYVWRTLDASRNRPPYLIDVVKTSGQTENEADKAHKKEHKPVQPEKPEPEKEPKAAIDRSEPKKSRRKR